MPRSYSPSSAAANGLSSIAADYLDDLRHRVSPSHFVNVKSRLERTLLALSVDEVAALRPLDVVRYRNRRREEGASNRTANLVVDTLNAMFAWAVGCGVLESNPLRNLRRLPDGPGHQRCRRRALSDDEIDRFLLAAEEDDRATAAIWSTMGGGAADHRRHRERVPQAPLWWGFLESGARWSELTRVRWGDLDTEQRTLVLRLENTKSKKRRVLPLRAQMMAVLEALRTVHERVLLRAPKANDLVFLTPQGVQWTRPTNNAMRLLVRVLARAGIPRVDEDGRKLDIHSLRHTYGSRLARHGAGLVQVQRLLGHSDPKLTAVIYTHLDVEDLRRAVESV